MKGIPILPGFKHGNNGGGNGLSGPAMPVPSGIIPIGAAGVLDTFQRMMREALDRFFLGQYCDLIVDSLIDQQGRFSMSVTFRPYRKAINRFIDLIPDLNKRIKSIKRDMREMAEQDGIVMKNVLDVVAVQQNLSDKFCNGLAMRFFQQMIPVVKVLRKESPDAG